MRRPYAGLGKQSSPDGDRNPARLGKSRAAVAERRRLYAGARESGLDSWQAAEAAGVDPVASGPRYERWYQAGRPS